MWGPGKHASGEGCSKPGTAFATTARQLGREAGQPYLVGSAHVPHAFIAHQPSLQADGVAATTRDCVAVDTTQACCYAETFVELMCLATGTFPGDSRLHVSHETIYLSLFGQTRGVLKQALIAHLRRRRRMRRSKLASTAGQQRGRIIDAVSIRERPAEAEHRAVPGHWEGGLLSGARNSRVGALRRESPATPRRHCVRRRSDACVAGTRAGRAVRLRGRTEALHDRGRDDGHALAAGCSWAASNAGRESAGASRGSSPRRRARQNTAHGPGARASLRCRLPRLSDSVVQPVAPCPSGGGKRSGGRSCWRGSCPPVPIICETTSLVRLV